MKRSELERKLRRGGWELKSGSKHNYVINLKNPKQKIYVPRGSEVNEITAKSILKKAGLL
ncbi:MAG: type II toxin-antitoxin system HicA family toxin [Oscillospiraceae bacterium]|jgi:predicted RNA binding protein YcfA (HicA-like mRNA interferase family)|nr:type II toxin-antitoxin system HicA family toxin [Oscillospiraceae bacterium]